MLARPRLILALLTGLNLLNYLDRLVVSAVLPKIQDDLHLSNFMGGLLATIFLVGYFVTAPVFGALGDRGRIPRSWLIASGVIVWSAATCASGLATTASGLLAARAFVGVGEASYATLAPTIIDDLTDADYKNRALAWFYGAMPFGSALGYLVGGFVEARWGWRAAFFVAGAPGLLLGLLCLGIVEPVRVRTASSAAEPEKANITRDLRTIVGATLYRKAVVGYCAYTAAVGAFSFWAPKFLYARYGLPLKSGNFKFGLITVIAGVLATIIGGRWGDQVRARVVSTAKNAFDIESNTVRGLLRICAVGSAVGAPLALACFLSPAPNVFFGLAFLCIFSLFLSTSPINAVILQSVPAQLRASAMALSIFSIHVFGDLWSPPLVGVLADWFPIERAMLALPFAIALSSALWWPRHRREGA